jgi:SAM-dependent methyltransferase
MTLVDYSFTRYLAAKKSVDDRALNRHVWESLSSVLPAATPSTPLRVLEVGAGVGTMLERLLNWSALSYAAYTGVDADPTCINEAYRRLPDWGSGQGFDVGASLGQMHFQQEGREISVEFEAIDVFDFVARAQGRRTWDLLLAHAFMDLVDVPTALPSLFSLLRAGGLFYFTIVFDGATSFQPEIEPVLDARIETLYHQTMDQRITAGGPSGDSRTGRHLFDHLRAFGAELLDAGGSDWVVFAGPGGYSGDEAFFLHFILHTIHSALEGHPDLDPARFTDWIEQRHAEVNQGRLVYIAHQMDFLGRI